MEGCHYKASVPLPDLTMLSCHPEIGVKQLLGGDPSHTQNDLRVNELQNLVQPGTAGQTFLRHRVAVLRRTALHNIGDEHISVPGKSHLFQHLVQKLSAASHKGLALFVLIAAGALPYDHNPGIGNSCPQYRLGPSLTQSAVPALLQILLHLPEYGCP